MQKIKLNFCDFWGELDPENNFFTNLLRTKYDVEISKDPDYLIYSCFNRKHLEYDCVRIFFTGENLFPNFNICDYGMGFEHLNFPERYLRLPLYYLFESRSQELNRNRVFPANDQELLDRKFCNFVYSNGRRSNPIREEFFYALSKYKQVDSGGRFLNNLGYRVGNKKEFQNQYKFSIAFENASSLGYTTEKIYEAFIANTVPIYWGNPRVDLEFNPDSFIDCSKFATMDEVIAKVIELDNDDEKYLKMLKTPYLYNNEFYDINNQKILAFFDMIFANGPNHLLRKHERVALGFLQETKTPKVRFQRFIERNSRSNKKYFGKRRSWVDLLDDLRNLFKGKNKTS